MKLEEIAGGFDLYDEDESVPTAGPQARKQAEEKESQQKQQTPQDTKTMEEKVRTVTPERSAVAQQIPQDFTKQQTHQDFTKTMEEKVRAAIPEWSAEPPTICQVPGDLAEGNTGAYTPKVVCIGPLFGSKRTTADMLRLERYKWCCVRKLILGRHPGRRLEPAHWSPEVHGPVLHQCFDKMMRLVPRVCASYYSISVSTDTSGSGTNDHDLALNMLLDGCFVLHRLLKYARMAKRSSGEGNGSMDGHDDYDDDDDDWTQVFGHCWIWGSVKRDLLLLANQVPFFVVRKLFKHLMSNVGKGDDVLVHGGLHFFSSLHPRQMHSAPIACDEVHHLLHLFYLSIDLPVPPSLSLNDHHESTRRHAAQPSSELTRWMPCAKELEEAGVCFRPRKRGAASFLDVKFCGGVLEIPPLELYDYSEPLFRNLIAFEHTYPATHGRVTAYAIFMDCLLKTTEDGRLLHQSGVLVNHMNGVRDETAMRFFSRICAEAHSSADRNYLAGVMDEVAKYQNARWPRWRAALVSNYFTNPWVITSVIAASFLLVLTVLQSFYSVYGYYKPTN